MPKKAATCEACGQKLPRTRRRPTMAPMTSAQKVAAFRARAKAAGKCGVCGKRKPRPGKADCAACANAARDRKAGAGRAPFLELNR